MEMEGTATAGASTVADEVPAIKGRDIPWVILGRHDLLALLHGLTPQQGAAWISLLAEAISAGQA